MIQPRLATFGRRALPLEFFAGLEHLEHVADVLRVVARLDHVLHAETIRFHFVLAAVALHPGLRADVGELPDGIRAGEDGGGHGAERRGHALRLATRRMTRGDVADLVAQHAGQLGFGIEVHQQAAVDVDVAAAGGEGVDGFVVDDEELEFFVGQVAGLRETLADQVHVFLRGLIVVQAQRLDDFLVVLLDGLLLAVHGAHDDVLAAGRGVGGAARGEDDRGREAES